MFTVSNEETKYEIQLRRGWFRYYYVVIRLEARVTWRSRRYRKRLDAERAALAHSASLSMPCRGVLNGRRPAQA